MPFLNSLLRTAGKMQKAKEKLGQKQDEFFHNFKNRCTNIQLDVIGRPRVTTRVKMHQDTWTK